MMNGVRLAPSVGIAFPKRILYYILFIYSMFTLINE